MNLVKTRFKPGLQCCNIFSCYRWTHLLFRISDGRLGPPPAGFGWPASQFQPLSRPVSTGRIVRRTIYFPDYLWGGTMNVMKKHLPKILKMVKNWVLGRIRRSGGYGNFRLGLENRLAGSAEFPPPLSPKFEKSEFYLSRWK